jgi:zinc protease
MRTLMKLKWLALPVLCALFALPGRSLASPDIQHWKTAGGARVYFVHAAELPIIDIRVLFDAGSARAPERPGLAGMTNALLNEGAGGLDAQAIATRFESLGAQYSAEAERDMAVVSLRSLTDREFLQPALEMLNKTLTAPDFPKDALERLRQRMLVGLKFQRQSPGEIVKKVFYKSAFGDHPYAAHPDGDESSLKSITRSHVLDFYQRYYVARNAVIAIVGNVDRKQAEAIAMQITAGLAKGKAAQPLPNPQQLKSFRKVRIDHPSTQSHILMGQPGLRRGDKDYFALYVGNHILGGSGLVSRLSQEIREKRGLSYSVYSYFLPMRVNGPYMLGLQTETSQVDEALELLGTTLVRFLDKGPTQAELTASKKNITGGFPLRIDSNRKIVEYLAMIGFYELPLDYLDTFTAKINAVTIDDIRKAFRRRVHPGKMVTVIVGSKATGG